MDTLRIILILLGVLLVLGIYLVDRIRRQRAARPPHDWHKIDGYNEEAVSTEEHIAEAERSPDPGEWVGKAFVARRSEQIDESQLAGLKGMADLDDGELEAIPPMHAERITAADLDDAAPRQRIVAGQPSSSDREQQQELAEQVVVLTLMATEGTRLRGTRLLKALQDSGLQHGDMEIFHFTPEGQRQPLFSAANILEPGRFVLSEMAQMETPGIALFMQLPGPVPNHEALQLMLQRARQIAASLGATLCDGQRQPLDDKALTALERRVLGRGN